MWIRQTVNVFGWMAFRWTCVDHFRAMNWRMAVSMCGSWYGSMMIVEVFIPRWNDLMNTKRINSYSNIEFVFFGVVPCASDWFDDGDGGIWYRDNSCDNTSTIWIDATVPGTGTKWILTIISSLPSHQRLTAESRIFWFWSIWWPERSPRMTAAIYFWRISLQKICMLDLLSRFNLNLSERIVSVPIVLT